MLIKRLASIEDIEGLSISGGEPTEQTPALLRLLSLVREETDLSLILFSGRTLYEILLLPGGAELISLIDVLVDGPYDRNRINQPGVWPSSSNQKIHFFSSRYSLKDFQDLPILEAIVTEGGEVIRSGLGACLPGAS
jgi:anaerobic ribonucleoside-triphosphate reductase activating protein